MDTDGRDALILVLKERLDKLEGQVWEQEQFRDYFWKKTYLRLKDEIQYLGRQAIKDRKKTAGYRYYSHFLMHVILPRSEYLLAQIIDALKGKIPDTKHKYLEHLWAATFTDLGATIWGWGKSEQGKKSAEEAEYSPDGVLTLGCPEWPSELMGEA